MGASMNKRSLITLIFLLVSTSLFAAEAEAPPASAPKHLNLVLLLDSADGVAPGAETGWLWANGKIPVKKVRQYRTNGKSWFESQPEGFENRCEMVAVHTHKEEVELVAKILTATGKPALAGCYVAMKGHEGPLEVISKGTAVSKIKQMLKKSQPDPEAVRQATSGKQSLETLRDALPEELRVADQTCVVS